MHTYIYVISHLHALLQHTLESDLGSVLHFGSVTGSLGEDMLRPDSRRNSNLGTLSVIVKEKGRPATTSALTIGTRQNPMDLIVTCCPWSLKFTPLFFTAS